VGGRTPDAVSGASFHGLLRPGIGHVTASTRDQVAGMAAAEGTLSDPPLPPIFIVNDYPVA
jgi:hypothetical protein